MVPPERGRPSTSKVHTAQFSTRLTEGETETTVSPNKRVRLRGLSRIVIRDSAFCSLSRIPAQECGQNNIQFGSASVRHSCPCHALQTKGAMQPEKVAPWGHAGRWTYHCRRSLPTRTEPSRCAESFLPFCVTVSVPHEAAIRRTIRSQSIHPYGQRVICEQPQELCFCGKDLTAEYEFQTVSKSPLARNPVCFSSKLAACFRTAEAGGDEDGGLNLANTPENHQVFYERGETHVFHRFTSRSVLVPLPVV